MKDRLSRSEMPLLVPVLVGAGFLLATVALQRLAHAFTDEFGADSASHYISGLMVHDYLVAGRFANPVKYLSDFHSHYPLVGIGGWPPLFYFVEALWMVVFSTSRASVLLLSAAMTVATAMTIYFQAWRAAGVMAGLCAGMVFVLSPLMQDATSDLMLDVPVGLVMLLAMLAWARYLERGTARYSVLFGVLAVAGLLIKGNAGCLALLPPLTVLFGRRFDLLRKIRFWLPVPIVIIGAGPWYFLTYQRPAAGFRFSAGFEYMSLASQFNLRALSDALGPVVLAIALIGLMRIVVMRSNPRDALGVCAASLALSVFLFLIIIPVALQARYLILALPPLLLLATLELNRWRHWLVPRLRSTALAPLVFAVLVLSVLRPSTEVPAPRDFGINEAARQVWSARLPGNPSVLLATDAAAEPSLIAALAMVDPHRPSLFVVRGSRLLGDGGYNNQDYRPRFHDAEGVAAAIDRYAIPLVILRYPGDPGDWAHIAQVDGLRRSDPTRWRTIYRDERHVPNITLFQIAGNDQKTADAGALTTLSAPNALLHSTSPPP